MEKNIDKLTQQERNQRFYQRHKQEILEKAREQYHNSSQQVKQAKMIAFQNWRQENDMKRTSVDMPLDEHERFLKKVKKLYKKGNMKSYVIRVLMHGWIEGLIDIKGIEIALEQLPHDMYVGGYVSVEGRNRNEFGQFE